MCEILKTCLPWFCATLYFIDIGREFFSIKYALLSILKIFVPFLPAYETENGPNWLHQPMQLLWPIIRLQCHILLSPYCAALTKSIQSNDGETQPVIGYWAFTPAGNMLDYTVAVSMPSYVPHQPSGLPDRMSFLQRATNIALKAGWWLITR